MGKVPSGSSFTPRPPLELALYLLLFISHHALVRLLQRSPFPSIKELYGVYTHRPSSALLLQHGQILQYHRFPLPGRGSGPCQSARLPTPVLVLLSQTVHLILLRRGGSQDVRGCRGASELRLEVGEGASNLMSVALPDPRMGFIITRIARCRRW